MSSCKNDNFALHLSWTEKSRQEQLAREQAGERFLNQSRIAKLESELNVLKGSAKRARIDTEKDHSKELQEKTVSSF